MKKNSDEECLVDLLTPLQLIILNADCLNGHFDLIILLPFQRTVIPLVGFVVSFYMRNFK